MSKEDEVEKFYEELTSVTRQVPKHNILIIGGDFNAQLGQSDGFKYAYHSETNRNGSILKDYLNENNLLCLNTKFQKRPGHLWTHKSPTGGKAQLDYIIINQKWKNSVKNCRAYNSFVSVASDQRIVTAKIRLSLRANKKKRNNNIPYDWSTLKDDSDLRNTFIIRVNNRFTALQDQSQTRNADTTYSNFETAIKETAFDTIPLKPKVKKHTPWENREICEKREQLHKAANVKQSNPSPENTAYYENALSDLKEAYKLEQTKYLERQIDYITNAVDNQKAAAAWKVVNEISGKKSCNSSKLKASSQEERVSYGRNTSKIYYSLSPGVWQSFVTIRSCNHLMRIISTYVNNTKKSEIA